MEVILQSEGGDAYEPALRLIIDERGCIMFQYRSVDRAEWTDVDDIPIQFEFAL